MLSISRIDCNAITPIPKAVAIFLRDGILWKCNLLLVVEVDRFTSVAESLSSLTSPEG